MFLLGPFSCANYDTHPADGAANFGLAANLARATAITNCGDAVWPLATSFHWIARALFGPEGGAPGKCKFSLIGQRRINTSNAISRCSSADEMQFTGSTVALIRAAPIPLANVRTSGVNGDGSVE